MSIFLQMPRPILSMYGVDPSGDLKRSGATSSLGPKTSKQSAKRLRAVKLTALIGRFYQPGGLRYETAISGGETSVAASALEQRVSQRTWQLVHPRPSHAPCRTVETTKLCTFL